ncbi:MAG: hypothetical protein WDW36_008395 [Sanguina aurantia]
MQEVYEDDAATHPQPVHFHSKRSPAASSARDSTDSSASTSTSSATSMPRAPEPVLTGSSPFQQHQPASASTPPPTPAAPATSVPNTYASAARTSSCSSPSAADRTPITSEGGPHASRSTAQPNSPPQHHPSARALTPTKQLGQQPCSQHHPLPPDSSSLEPPDNFRPTPQADGHQTEQQQQQRVKVPPSTLLQAIAKEVSRKLFLATLVDTKEDHDVIIQEVFVDLTRVLDKNAQSALHVPPCYYYEVLAQHYADPGSAASALDLLRLFQGLWNHCWIAPVYALLLHRCGTDLVEVTCLEAWCR